VGVPQEHWFYSRGKMVYAFVEVAGGNTNDGRTSASLGDIR
jgi:hypothetical protein